MLQVPFANKVRWTYHLNQLLRATHLPFIEHFYRDNKRQYCQKGSALRSREKPIPVFIIYIKFHEVVRQGGIENGMLGIQPLAIQNVSLAQHFPQFTDIAIGPSFEEVKLLFPWPTGQIMSPALEHQTAIVAEANGAVRAIHLLLNDYVPSRQTAYRDGGEIFIAALDA